MTRIDLARSGQHGTEVLTIEQLAGRLAGGFLRAADSASVYDAVNVVLGHQTLTDLERVRKLPGMARATVNSLGKIWREATPVTEFASHATRAADIVKLDVAVRKLLPANMLAPPDLAAAAVINVGLCAKLYDSISLRGILDVDPVWRPLMRAIVRVMPFHWPLPDEGDRAWLGTDQPNSLVGTGVITGAEICADPRAEALEALRWARSLLSSGNVLASEISLVATSPSTWDEHLLVLSDGAFTLHFCHGRPALGTAAGQACAALADTLLHGLSQDRVRRLQRLSPYLRGRLPLQWMNGLRPGAGLFSAEHWRRALRLIGDEPSQAALVTLEPVLEMLESGIGAAEEAGELLLAGKSLLLWKEALRRAPADALQTTLKSLRVPDETDPGRCVVWGSAADLVSAPRKYVRLIGVSARSWPRGEADDPILPERMMQGRKSGVSTTDIDRRHFSILVAAAEGDCVVSCSSRSAEGTILGPSPLWPTNVAATQLGRTRIPCHAANEADRLLARPGEARTNPQIEAAQRSWINRGGRAITNHDGRVRPQHPAIIRAITRTHSSTSLRRLLRDPQGFLWKYGLDLFAPRWATRPLELEPAIFGELVHALIKQTIDLLHPQPGLAGATSDQIKLAIRDAARLIQDEWPLTRPVPPTLLWRYTLEDAVRRTKRALVSSGSDGDILGPGARTWGEVSFGGSKQTEAPWQGDVEVALEIGGQRVRLEGRIDRLDVGADQRTVTLSDYKTGTVPLSPRTIVLDGGREIQRTLYAMAVRQLLGDGIIVTSQLVFLDPSVTTAPLAGDRLSRAEVELARGLDIAARILLSGDAPPGPDARQDFNELRLLLPADLDRYLARKQEGFEIASADLSPLWGGQ